MKKGVAGRILIVFIFSCILSILNIWHNKNRDYYNNMVKTVASGVITKKFESGHNTYFTVGNKNVYVTELTYDKYNVGDQVTLNVSSKTYARLLFDLNTVVLCIVNALLGLALIIVICNTIISFIQWWVNGFSKPFIYYFFNR